jgi:drug/metabolite transporter (DMT)-like permease
MTAGKKGVNYLLGVAIAATIATILQMYGTLRYVRRLPDDTFGVTLYIVTCVLFAVVATVNYIRWAREK